MAFENQINLLTNREVEVFGLNLGDIEIWQCFSKFSHVAALPFVTENGDTWGIVITRDCAGL